MARTESESIYLDLQSVQTGLTQVQDFYTPRNLALNGVRKFALVEQLDTEFTIARTEFHIADDEHVWRGKKDEYGNCKCALRMADLMAKIDDGIGRWRTSMLKGRPAPEMQ